MPGLRAMVSSPRAHVVALVGALSALGGAVAGGIAALIAATVLTPAEPVGLAQIAAMAAEYGLVAAIAGGVLGTIVAFGALRRVPMGRLLLYTNAGLAAGLTAGWLGGPWAWHHMGLLGSAGFVAGPLLARAFSLGHPAPRSALPFESVVAGGAVPATQLGAGPALPMSPGLVVPADGNADRVRRGRS